MKLRDINPGDPTTHRQALGYAINQHRTGRGKTIAEVARRARVSAGDVESWERGATVPNSEQWRALCQGISRQLHGYGDIWRSAQAEEKRERDRIEEALNRSKTMQSNGHSSLTTKLGDKLAGVVATDKPKPGSLLPPIVTTQAPSPDARTVTPGVTVTYHNEPRPGATVDFARDVHHHDNARKQLGLPEERTPDGRRRPPPVPPGGRTASAIEMRKKFVRELLLSRPNIRTQGRDSVVEAVRHRFGIGISPEFVDDIRNEINGTSTDKHLHEKSTAESTRPSAPVVSTEAEAKPGAFAGVSTERAREFVEAAATGNPDHDITAAVELILGAIPNLQTFTIDVDDEGNASVDYQVKVVKVTTHTGSLKVARRP